MGFVTYSQSRPRAILANEFLFSYLIRHKLNIILNQRLSRRLILKYISCLHFSPKFYQNDQHFTNMHLSDNIYCINEPKEKAVRE